MRNFRVVSMAGMKTNLVNFYLAIFRYNHLRFGEMAEWLKAAVC